MAADEQLMNIGATIIEIDKKFIERILRCSEKDNELIVESFTTIPLTKKGDNYTSFILGVEATACFSESGVKKDFHLVAKLAPSDERRREFGEIMQFFPKENFMYNVYFPTLIELQKERGVTDPVVPSIPRIYNSPDEKESILVFGNICADGYKLADKWAGCTYEMAKIVMVQLGRFHALSHIFVQDYNRNHTDVLLTDKHPVLKHGMSAEFFEQQGRAHMTKAMDNSINIILPLAEERGNADLADKLRTYLGVGGKLMEDLLGRRDGLMAIIHGDCWINNMMFKFENDKPVGVMLLDFQASRLAGCALEMNYFVYTSIGKKVRDDHLEELLGIYHKEMQETWNNMNEKVEYTLEDLIREFNSYKIGGFLYALLGLPVVLARFEDIMHVEKFKEIDRQDPVAVKTLMDEAQLKMRNNAFFTTRLIDIVDEMYRKGVL